MADGDGLWLEGLRIQAGDKTLVQDASLALEPGRIVALVGASGSGKTLTARACIGLVEPRPGVVAGRLRVRWQGRSWAPYERAGSARRRELRELRGTVVGWLPQQARAALDPLLPVGRQVSEVLRLRAADGIPSPAGRSGVAAWLEAAGFSHPDQIARRYAHELSGGQAQRASIALALARGSRFLLADEPTTGLDPTVQAAILDRLAALRAEGCGVLLITHDLRIVPRLADELLVMEAGRIAESLPADGLSQARSDAARRLVDATSRIAAGRL